MKSFERQDSNLPYLPHHPPCMYLTCIHSMYISMRLYLGVRIGGKSCFLGAMGGQPVHGPGDGPEDPMPSGASCS